MRMLTGEKIQGFVRVLHKLMETFDWNGHSRPDLLEERNLIVLLEQAQKEWNHAKVYFNNVTEPDLIDYAVFYMGAAEKKYIYLLKRVRDAGVSIKQLNFGD